ncbi:MAG: TonB-dependent receptor family protein [Muribaculaceae bacterium]|nr:TonB-dependent receptor family protein [Muribaculaceae bacterium]
MTTFFKGILAILAIAFASSAYAQTLSVKGCVRDSVGEPESFATLRIYQFPDTIKPKVSGTADENGIFNIKLPEAGSYRVNILSFGKQDINRNIAVDKEYPTVDLGTLVTTVVSSMLQEVTVTAQRPLVVKEIDRIGYDVQADEESKTSQLDEILKKVPLVSVDPDGTIKIKGSTDFKVYKNGRPNNSFSRNAKDIFKALPASMIKRIEVITDPGAREDAEGTTAILNIVTLENTVIKGVMGNVRVSYSKTDDAPNASTWLQTQIDKVNLSFYGGYNRLSRKSYRHKSESLTKYEDSGNELHSESTGTSHGNLGYFGIEGSYEPDTLNLVSTEFNGYIYSLKSNSTGINSMRSGSGNLIYSYGNNYRSDPNRYFDIDGSLNYQRSTRKKGETLTLSYRISSTNQRQHSMNEYEDELNMPVDYTGTSNDFTLDFIEHTGQFDWTRPINDINKFDVGLKYINRNNHSINDQDYFGAQELHSDFTHNTQVFAVYLDYRLKLKKFGARAGLRYEYSRLAAKYRDGSNDPFSSNLNDWVPNAAISYDLNDANTLKLSYSTRINRPGISQLNPAVVETPTSISSGNPDLGSSRHQSINLNYNLIGRKFSLDFGTSYSFMNNAVISVQELQEGDIIKSGYANAGHNKWFNIALWMNYTPWSKTSFMLNANVNYAHRSNSSLDLSSHGWGGYAFLRVRQQLPWDLALTGYVSAYQSTPDLYSINKTPFSDQIDYGLDLQKSFLKEKRLSVSLGIRNPFGHSVRLYESEPRNSGYTGYTRSYSYNSANNFNISVSYRFGSLNASVKKTNKSISNDDVENRKN